MVTENRRQALLREIGIQCWFPRTALPGAAPSHDDTVFGPEPHEADDTVTAAAQPAVRDSGQPEHSGQARDGHEPDKVRPADAEPHQRIPSELKAVLTAGHTGTTAATGPAAGPNMNFEQAAPAADSDSATALADEPVPEFAFSWFNVDKRLAVLAMMPAGGDRLSSSCRQMLKRILAALSPDYMDIDLQEHTFHWPFPGDLGLPTGRLAARQAVDGFVARRLREQPSAMLLILADDTPPFLYSDKIAADEDLSGALFVHRQFGFAMLRTSSLHAMDANSELKRTAWQAMKSLRDRLNRGAG